MGPIARFKRSIIQLLAVLLYNLNFEGFATGSIYQGDTKGVCVPGLNCYSCPGAIGACPIGSLQAALVASDQRLPLYIIGTILAFGALLGRSLNLGFFLGASSFFGGNAVRLFLGLDGLDALSDIALGGIGKLGALANAGIAGSAERLGLRGIFGSSRTACTEASGVDAAGTGERCADPNRNAQGHHYACR